MVLQIVADARQLVHHLDAVRAQVPGRADARELEELRRVDGAAGEHDLAPRLCAQLAAVLAVAHGRRPPALEGDAA